MVDSEIKKMAKKIVKENVKINAENLEFTPNEKFAITIGLILGVGVTALIERSKLKKQIKILERRLDAYETRRFSTETKDM